MLWSYDPDIGEIGWISLTRRERQFVFPTLPTIVTPPLQPVASIRRERGLFHNRGFYFITVSFSRPFSLCPCLPLLPSPLVVSFRLEGDAGKSVRESRTARHSRVNSYRQGRDHQVFFYTSGVFPFCLESRIEIRNLSG